MLRMSWQTRWVGDELADRWVGDDWQTRWVGDDFFHHEKEIFITPLLLVNKLLDWEKPVLPPLQSSKGVWLTVSHSICSFLQLYFLSLLSPSQHLYKAIKSDIPIKDLSVSNMTDQKAQSLMNLVMQFRKVGSVYIVPFGFFLTYPIRYAITRTCLSVDNRGHRSSAPVATPSTPTLDQWHCTMMTTHGPRSNTRARPGMS